MKNIIIGGVPEHFNLPWYIGLKNKEFQKQDVNLRWKDFPDGTGAMCEALRKAEIDMAVILTEGIIRDIINGNTCKIVQVFVKSPLIWGIHVAADSTYENLEDLRGTKAAISRFGSGSHLMAIVNAENNNWNLDTDLDFEVIKDLEGAVEKMPKGIGDYFMWEKFMTKPYVDEGIFRIVGESPTPWPCFVIAVRNELLENDPTSIQNILDVINQTTISFKSFPEIDTVISERYGQKLEDVRQWLELTHWSQAQICEEDLENVQNHLLMLDLIDTKIPAKEFIYNF